MTVKELKEYFEDKNDDADIVGNVCIEFTGKISILNGAASAEISSREIEVLLEIDEIDNPSPNKIVLMMIG